MYNAHLSACSHTNTPQNNSLFERFQGLYIQGLSFCLQLHYHTTQLKNNSIFERFQGLCIQGLSLRLQLHYHTTQPNSKTTHSLNAFRASAYKACLSACSRTSEACMLRPMPSAMYALDNSGWLLPMAIAFLDHWMPCSY